MLGQALAVAFAPVEQKFFAMIVRHQGNAFARR